MNFAEVEIEKEKKNP